jgi:hypothetical protein
LTSSSPFSAQIASFYPSLLFLVLSTPIHYDYLITLPFSSFTLFRTISHPHRRSNLFFPLPQLGEPCFDKLEACLAHAMLSIPSTKAFEVGSGFRGTEVRGSNHNDAFVEGEDGKLKCVSFNPFLLASRYVSR